MVHKKNPCELSAFFARVAVEDKRCFFGKAERRF